MLQEQVSEYLGVTSFKRKYPGESADPSYSVVPYSARVPIVMQRLNINESNRGKCIDTDKDKALKADKSIDTDKAPFLFISIC